MDPFTGIDHDLIDLANGTLDGSVTFTFANGETLFAAVGLEIAEGKRFLLQL